MNVQAKVKMGAAFLDTYGPENWFNRVDTGRLDQANPDRCVLGQVYCGYRQGCMRLNLDDRQARQLGFDISFWWVIIFQRWDRYGDLTDAWNDLIHARKVQYRRAQIKLVPARHRRSVGVGI